MQETWQEVVVRRLDNNQQWTDVEVAPEIVTCNDNDKVNCNDNANVNCNDNAKINCNDNAKVNCNDNA